MKNILFLLLASATFAGAQITVNVPTINISSNDEKVVTFHWNNYKDANPQYVTNVVGTNSFVVTNLWLTKREFCVAQITNYWRWNFETQWRPAYKAAKDSASDLRAFLEEFRDAEPAKQNAALAAALNALK